MESLHAGVDGAVAQLLLDAQQLVVLRHTLGTAGRAGLDLAGVQGHGQIGDGGVLGLAGAVGADGGEMCIRDRDTGEIPPRRDAQRRRESPDEVALGDAQTLAQLLYAVKPGVVPADVLDGRSLILP